MARATEVPINPAVLRWAIEESGVSKAQLAGRVKVDHDVLERWLSGKARPNRTQFGRLRTATRRQAAVFFLPAPPSGVSAPVHFRHPHDSRRETMNARERRLVRRAGRLQRTVSWLAQQLGDRTTCLPEASLIEEADGPAGAAREHLGIPIDEQLRWRSPVEAQRKWRTALEGAGVIVMLLPLGEESSRGFSLWDPYAPLVAANTAWNYQARAFSLFHEVGHLLLRSNSACLGYPGRKVPKRDDPEERWCERFAAAFLLPESAVRHFVLNTLRVRGRHVQDITAAGRLANAFSVSLRATVLRLIDCGLADWELWRKIPPLADHKRKGGPATGGGRRRPRKRLDKYGARTVRTFLEGIENDLITTADVRSQLNVQAYELDLLRHPG